MRGKKNRGKGQSVKGKNNAAVVALRNCSGVFCGLREAAMYGNANNNRLFLLFRIGKPFFCAPTDRNVSVGLFKIVVAFAFSYALCKVLSCKTFIIASVFNSYKSKIRHYPLPPRSASRSLRVSMSRSSAAGVG
uniref:hypothetical protein n=1 Tax=Gemmiger formicilis TaxID=745368 RepID=UPI003FEE8460